MAGFVAAPFRGLGGCRAGGAAAWRGTPIPGATGAPALPLRQWRRRPLPPCAVFDLPLNWNHTDWLKVPRGQVQITLYPWMEGHQRRECMRRWLQAELCMSESQARAALKRCPGLGELDVRLARRRLRALHAQLGLSRCDVALLALRRPALLLPTAADVVGFALGARGQPPRQPR